MTSIGKNRSDIISFFAKRDFVQCKCYNYGSGGTLEEFKRYIEKECLRGGKECREYQEEYLAANSFFERMKKLHSTENE